MSDTSESMEEFWEEPEIENKEESLETEKNTSEIDFWDISETIDHYDESEKDTSKTIDHYEESEKGTSETVGDLCDESEKDSSETIGDLCDELEKDTSVTIYLCDESEKGTSETVGDLCDESEKDSSETIRDLCDELEKDTRETIDLCYESEKDTSENIGDLCDELEKDISEISADDTASEIATKIWNIMERDEQKARKNMPKVIAIQKKKFLLSINEISDEKLSKEDEYLMKSFTSSMYFSTGVIRKLFKPQSIVWDDSKAYENVKEILKNHNSFQVSKYLECAKIVFLAYSGKMEHRTEGTDAMEYVLTHARQFGDTTKTIFRIDVTNEILEQESEVGSDTEKIQLQALPANKLLKKISQLIEDLKTTYDETKFVILNVNTTYFTLLMLRRIVKNEVEFFKAFKKIHTHDNYVKLCPIPLDNQLPKCEFKICKKQLVDSAYLAIETYLNTKDEKTKRVLRATCILYMEWNALQLPDLFFKVVNLYKVKAEELYDLLFVDDCEYPALATCFNLVGGYHNIYEKLKTGVTNIWFPYCRVLNGAYHIYLSAKENVEICTVLAYLVDLKIGFDRSSVRMSHWVESHPSEKYMQIATTLHEKLNKTV